ncbi:sigma-70 RNA polymerase sigma factor region 4 domain-containing protein [Enterovibrio norvegicus]|uniref:sigma-70 family RNA polymerase sigma factor n=1 Tax=Enterovibrio norvegicus TaxID=188144 RepID=UPI00105525C9|nr:sigma-70 family RNA polymerase sigma factor [Enterovibrio norvegicus]
MANRTSTEALFDTVRAELKPQIFGAIRKKALVFCDDDMNECAQMADIKLFQIISDMHAGKHCFETDAAMKRYCVQAIKHTIIDFNRRRFTVNAPPSQENRAIVLSLAFDHNQVNADSDDSGASLSHCNRNIKNPFSTDAIENLVDSDAFNHALECLQNNSNNLIEGDLNIIRERHLYDKSYEQIAEELGLSARHVSYKIKQSTESVRALATALGIDKDSLFNN